MVGHKGIEPFFVGYEPIALPSKLMSHLVTFYNINTALFAILSFCFMIFIKTFDKMVAMVGFEPTNERV